MESATQQAKRISRFMELLPSGEDTTLVVLKGHLLLEELLTDIIEITLKTRNPLRITVTQNMMFARKLELCWALSQSESVPEQAWQSLKCLNAVRNKMSHHVEPSGISDSINNFIRDVRSHDSFGLIDCSDVRKLELAICCLYVIFNEHLHALTNS